MNDKENFAYLHLEFGQMKDIDKIEFFHLHHFKQSSLLTNEGKQDELTYIEQAKSKNCTLSKKMFLLVLLLLSSLLIINLNFHSCC